MALVAAQTVRKRVPVSRLACCPSRLGLYGRHGDAIVRVQALADELESALSDRVVLGCSAAPARGETTRI